MLARISNAVKSRYDPAIYSGARAALAPVDLLMSLLAKRSYPFYKLWYEYAAKTDIWFDGSPTCDGVDNALLEHLRSTGHLLVPARFEAASLREARDYVVRSCDAAKERADALDPGRKQPEVQWEENGIRCEVLREGGRIRLHYSPQALAQPGVPSLVREFARIDWVVRLVGAYFGASRVVTGLPYYMAEMMEPVPMLEPWHFDCLRPTVKVYLALEDIGPEQAPLRYVPRSQTVDEARHKLFYAVCRGGPAAAYFDREICRRLDSEATILTAPAGTFMLFDTRGSHAGSLCLRGRRVLLANGHRPLRTNRLNPRMFRDPLRALYPWQVHADFWDA